MQAAASPPASQTSERSCAQNHFIETTGSGGVRVVGLHAEAPNTSPNTDGINFYGGSDQLFADSL